MSRKQKQKKAVQDQNGPVVGLDEIRAMNRQLSELRDEIRLRREAIRYEKSMKEEWAAMGIVRTGLKSIEERELEIETLSTEYELLRDEWGAKFDEKLTRVFETFEGRETAERAVLASVVFWDWFGEDKPIREPEWLKEFRRAIDDELTLELDDVEVGAGLVSLGYTVDQATKRLLPWHMEYRAAAMAEDGNRAEERRRVAEEFGIAIAVRAAERR